MTAHTQHQRDASGVRESRHRAREAALQMLYHWEVGRAAVPEVIQAFWGNPPENVAGLPEELQQFANRLASGVVAFVKEIDPMIAEAAEHWRVERMNVMDRLVIRLAVYEFLHESETPGKVIINEALELARTFSGDEAVRFINGVLDAIRRTLGRE